MTWKRILILGSLALVLLVGGFGVRKFGGIAIGGGSTVVAQPYIITVDPVTGVGPATTTQFFGNVDPIPDAQYDLGQVGHRWRNITASGVLTVGSCVGCSGGATSTLQQVTNAGATTTNILYLQGGALVTGSSTFTGVLDLAGGANITVGGANPKKTLTLSAAGCNIPPFANGASTSSLAYFGEHVFRTIPFQPLTFGGCELDWLPPDSWDGSTLNCKFDYYATTTDANGVAWGIQAQGMGTGASLSTGFSSPTATVITVATTTNALTVTTSTALTVGGLTVDPELVKFRISRASTGSSTNTASFIGAKCEYGVSQFSD